MILGEVVLMILERLYLCYLERLIHITQRDFF